MAGSPSLLKVGPDYPPFLEAIVIPSRGFTKISGRILLHMLWDGIKVGFKKTKFLVVNLTEVMQDLYSESHKTLLRETKTK